MNLLLLAGGLLVFVSLLAGVYSARLGLSFLLVFLLAGMLAGVDGPGGVNFDSPLLSAWVGNVALAMILLEGGLNTRMSTFKRGFRPAVLLATVGVAITAGIVGAVAVWALKVEWKHGLLLGAIVASTDAAAVFSLLRQAGIRLNERVSATLEMESGLNDPMAVFLVLALIAMIKTDAGLSHGLMLLAKQAAFGVAVGWLGGAAIAWLLRKMPLGTSHGGLISLLILSGGLTLFAIAGLAQGSGFLAMYLYGLRVRARAEEAAHAAATALDGFAWAAQATMFLLLGLLVTPHDMLRAASQTVTIAAALMFVARPLAVVLCLAPLRFPWRQSLFIGWVGLRGAVPIVLALFPLLERVPGTARFFDVAFAVVLASLLLQGSTLSWLARKLGMVEPPDEPPPGEGSMQGRLVLDGDLPLAEVLTFFQLPLPEHDGVTLAEWLVAELARDVAEGDGFDWHGARFTVKEFQDDRIARVGITLAPRKR
ncbi:potassium/proton antiporter [Piscinibacter terrae]|nr:potassium/proton antiporter [Albitalea terrae]